MCEQENGEKGRNIASQSVRRPVKQSGCRAVTFLVGWGFELKTPAGCIRKEFRPMGVHSEGQAYG